MKEYDPLRSYMHNWFLGVHVKQYAIEFPIWELFFIHCGPLQRIIELGAGQGGFSFYLFLQAKKRAAAFGTWDILPIHMAQTRLGQEFGFDTCCHQANILKDDETIQAIRQLLNGRGTTLLFCDNGHKATEVKLYAPYLKPGDYLAVHDWEQEIFPKHLDGLPLKPYVIDEIEMLGSWTRFFKVTDD